MKDFRQTLSRLTLLLPLLVAARPTAADTPRFNRDVRPVLSDNCFHCHGPDPNHREAGLRLDLPQAAHEYAIVPGKRDQSDAYERMTSDDPERRMPPPRSNKHLSQREIEMIGRWIDAGADYQSHWAFMPPARAVPPEVQHSDWVANPIDAFVLAKLEKSGLSPSPPADKSILLRRVTLDLTGLPPTPTEVEAFLSDDSPDAFSRVVDRLLNAESFGERMAQMWLDAARYADTMGYQADWERFQWRWRSWVIDAYNRNMPFDQFTIEQLAGDLLPSPSVEQLIATGFNRNHRINDEGGIIPEEYLVEYIVDRVETTGGTWMGLTIGCARCHDHKYDPISQADFYRLFAFFNAVPEQGKEGRKGYATPYMRVAVRGMQQAYEAAKRQVADKQDSLERVIAGLQDAREQWIGQTRSALEAADSEAKSEIPREIADALRKPAASRTETQDQAITDYHANLAPETKQARDALDDANDRLQKFEDQHTTYVMVMREMDEPRQTFVLRRGVYDQPQQPVAAGVPDALLGPLLPETPPNRLGLAQWLVSGSHPLTSRVIVNRYWEMLFGAGLVETVEDFGLQGSYPSHPDLLDWLATEYPRIGWDTKKLLKRMVTSNTYQQSSVARPDLRARDANNRQLARMSRFRLPAETIRDQLLFASGLLVHKLGGPSVKPYQPEGLWKELSFQDKKRSTDFYQQDSGDGLYRRSVYTFWKRSVPPPAMATFDAPSREMCTLRRSRTNTPLQALALMNDTTYVEASRMLAERAIMQGGDDLDRRLRFVYRSLLSRDPDDTEMRTLAAGFERRHAYFEKNEDAARSLNAHGHSKRNSAAEPADLAAMTTCVMVVMNLDETVTRE